MSASPDGRVGRLVEKTRGKTMTTKADFVADVIGSDSMRELCALLVRLDAIEDPEREPVPAIEDMDHRAHARKCSDALRMLMRRIVGSGPNAQGEAQPE